ncbi:S26 family signal peptidase [Vibrio sp. 10N]|uniref:S26 family signal peptidase n=1 Tax=Vibrio sp. 10N TaxID=3058938 RepID=UPI0028145112|nr:hypothetical protein VB10N_46670 [Vibrio sp. 10N]
MSEVKSSKRSHPLSFPIKMIWLGIFMVIVFDIAITAFSKHYSIAIDPQEVRCIEEYRVYFMDKKVGEIQRGHIYAFSAKNLEPYFKDGSWLGKYASGIEGDTIVINKHGVFVNDRKVADGFAVAKKAGLDVETLYRTFTVGKGKIFFTGTAERSYDSRYYGLVDVSQIVGEATPIW